MISQLRSASMLGINALRVLIETHIDNGLFNFTLVGLPESAVRVSRERVCASITNSGVDLPPFRYTVNLAPSEATKQPRHASTAVGGQAAHRARTITS